MNFDNSSAEVTASKIRAALRSLCASSDTVEAAAVVSHDGLIIASVMSREVDVDRFGAMCASLLALANRAAKEIHRGDLRQIILDGSLGPMLLTRAGETGVLAVAATPSAKLGQLILDTRTTARAVSELTEPREA
ncbi:roadblock/LC7 domain-containing protein [Polaromonas sp.]|uniref:roadblock/LC7 domain-containing protein n=1 Tax=Polaromonas sp. TaxID=1869339 RepID=UPI003BB7C373